MKAAIHNPYWDTLGGGERYTASFISLLIDAGYKVDIEWSDKNILKEIKKRFDIDISAARIIEDTNRGDGYDLMFWVSDGSIPTLKSRNNILHFQFPFSDLNQNNLINKMKFFRIKHVVCNSEFTKSFIDREYGIKSEVVYPPVDVKSFKPKSKENKILYVGRFSQLTQSKNQHILVEEFKKLYDSGKRDWKLVLAGGAEVGGDSYAKKLRESAKGYPISIKISPSFKELKDLYGKSKIFWSAVGLDNDESKNPLKVEHFGMTVVEAMASKCVPIVPETGGYKEIIIDNKNGTFYSDKSDLIKQTLELIENRSRMQSLAKSGLADSEKYSLEQFNKKFSKLI